MKKMSVRKRNREFPSIIQDKDGRRYSLELAAEVDSVVMLAIRFKGQKAGNLNLTDIGSVLRIQDLFIKDDLFNNSSNILLRVLCSMGLYPKKFSLRGKGLGSALLNITKEYAQNNGYEGIDGRLAAKDLERTPYLREFYRNAGFQIIDDGGKARIWLSLKS